MGVHSRCSDFKRVKTSVKTSLPVPRNDARYPTRLRERLGYVTPGPTGYPRQSLSLLALPRVTKLLGWSFAEGVRVRFLRRILRQGLLDDAPIGRCAL